MGQRPSREIARLHEISQEHRRSRKLLDDLYDLAAAEAAAGKPATPGSHQARRAAVWDYRQRLSSESSAICAHLVAKHEGRRLPMPDPTPPLRLPPLPEPDAHAACAPASACGEQASTPMCSARSPTAQPGGSSSSEEGAHAGASGAACSDAVPLLAAGSGRLAPGLRRRQGRQESS